MFNRTPREKTNIEEAIDEAIATLNPYDDDYFKCVEAIKTLHELKQADKPDRVKADTIALVLGNLAGIVLITRFEKTGVVTSKALAFIPKLFR